MQSFWVREPRNWTNLFPKCDFCITNPARPSNSSPVKIIAQVHFILIHNEVQTWDLQGSESLHFGLMISNACYKTIFTFKASLYILQSTCCCCKTSFVSNYRFFFRLRSGQRMLQQITAQSNTSHLQRVVQIALKEQHTDKLHWSIVILTRWKVGRFGLRIWTPPRKLQILPLERKSVFEQQFLNISMERKRNLEVLLLQDMQLYVGQKRNPGVSSSCLRQEAVCWTFQQFPSRSFSAHPLAQSFGQCLLQQETSLQNSHPPGNTICWESCHRLLAIVPDKTVVDRKLVLEWRPGWRTLHLWWLWYQNQWQKVWFCLFRWYIGS